MYGSIGCGRFPNLFKKLFNTSRLEHQWLLKLRKWKLLERCLGAELRRRKLVELPDQADEASLSSVVRVRVQLPPKLQERRVERHPEPVELLPPVAGPRREVGPRLREPVVREVQTPFRGWSMHRVPHVELRELVPVLQVAHLCSASFVEQRVTRRIKQLKE